MVERRSWRSRTIGKYHIDDNGCWIWDRSKTPSGYGRISSKGKSQYLHRLAYVESFGEIPKGLCVCHTCDTPSCFNVDHLFCGTHKDNTDDSISKNRRAKGKTLSTYGGRKISDEDVAAIRRVYEENVGTVSQKQIGVWFGLSHQEISHIVRRVRWSHLGE